MDEDFEIFLSEASLEMATYLWREKDKIEEWRQALNSLLPRLSPYERREVELLLCGVPFGEWVEYLGITFLAAADFIG